MTDPTPRDHDAELHQLRAHRATIVEQARSAGADIAAILMIHRERRVQMLARMKLSPSDEAMTLLLLAVVDELTLDRDTDVIMQPIAARAAAALAVIHVPDTAAELLGDEP